MKHTVTVRVASNVMTSLKIFSVMFSLALASLPILIYSNGKEIFHLEANIFMAISIIGLAFFLTAVSIIYLSSRFSPIQSLQIRKKLILFTEQLTKQTEDGKLKHSVTWHYEVRKKKTTIQLYSNGLVNDKRKLGGQLSEFIAENLLSYKEASQYATFIFGKFPARLNGKEVLENDQL
ncbi:hypothetical protein [Listeria seeligeri]|uniref:hypothetical protein n=1 Tax=Listeria seeligeri TaxID=1640 RepID=UPI001886C430|nr:hypothetical protein [Listeria seeligeri]MBF2544892.1 hypothetical protein [Listeria seeligeri]